MGSIFFRHRETSGAGGQLRRPWALFLQMGLGPLSYRSTQAGDMDLRSARKCRQRWISLLLRGETDSIAMQWLCRLWLCLFSRQNLERMLNEVFDKGTRATSGDCSWILRIHHHLVVIVVSNLWSLWFASQALFDSSFTRWPTTSGLMLFDEQILQHLKLLNCNFSIAPIQSFVATLSWVRQQCNNRDGGPTDKPASWRAIFVFTLVTSSSVTACVRHDWILDFGRS